MPRLAIGLNVFGNHDGVINQQSDHDDQTKHGQEIEGSSGQSHEREGSAQRERQTDKHPPRGSPRQRKKQQHEDQHATHGGIACQKINSTLNKTGKITADGEVNLIWQHARGGVSDLISLLSTAAEIHLAVGGGIDTRSKPLEPPPAQARLIAIRRVTATRGIGTHHPGNVDRVLITGFVHGDRSCGSGACYPGVPGANGCVVKGRINRSKVGEWPTASRTRDTDV